MTRIYTDPNGVYVNAITSLGEVDSVPQFEIKAESVVLFDLAINRLDSYLVFAYLDDKTGLPKFYHRQDVIDGHIKVPGFYQQNFQNSSFTFNLVSSSK